MFKDRFEAGKKLAEKLQEELAPDIKAKTIVLGIPRGGAAIGKEISQALGIPLDCLITKKLPAPENEELAIGAVGEGGEVVWEEKLVERLAVSKEYKQAVVREKVTELEKKQEDFRQGRKMPDLSGKVVIIADDGVATGATIKVAIAVVRNFKPQEIIVAVPVIAKDCLEEIKERTDKIVYLEAPEMFFSVSQFYEDFRQFGDDEVRRLFGN